MKRPLAVGVVALFLMPIVATAVLTMTKSFEIKTLPILGQVPDFEFTERSGKKISKKDLERKAWVASFIFTGCAGECPMILGKLIELQKAFVFKENFRIVSFSMDPENDTPEVLSAYANEAKADPFKWLFLTGESKKIQELVKKGFLLPVAAGQNGTEEITHSGKLVLIDGYSRIRGYYDFSEEGTASIKDLKKDFKKLLKETY